VALGLGHGKILWQTYMAPSGYSGASVWGTTPVIDAARNSVYVGAGNNFSVPQVVENCFANNQNNPNCVASNDYFDSVVALDLTTPATSPMIFGGRAGERRLLGGVEPQHRSDYLADRNAWRMFAVGFRLSARLQGARAGKRRQRGRVRRIDGREPDEPDDVCP
jgi:hypothetical protein